MGVLQDWWRSVQNLNVVRGYSEMHVHFPQIRLFYWIGGPVLLFVSGVGGFVLWTGAEFV